ncbi:DUF4174 domain-containing protein [Shimia sp. MMG029]|uniref:DUF4174 domain-containing protein n=1 Tax=Shimia sp. MMG029 TaxID=3021978 RepID=UPI0022FEF19C|nr:DUF4174 domain-containing protein [Shimia sp. MMG029]MDA5555197.1 DUF4174 domain-containing protein [Shimia sp. MMG029]
MTHRLALVLIAFLSATGVAAQATEATPETGTENAENTPQLVRSGLDADPEAFLWVNRLIVVFADTPRDPRFAQQMELIEAQPDDLRVRDVVVFTDTDPAAQSALRQKLRPRGFMMAMIGKDGTVYFRKPLPWSVREISANIDKNPLRQQEIRDRRQP